MPQSYARLYVHIIFGTKQRQRSIKREWASRLYEYIAGVLRKQGCHLILGGGTEDHVHLLVSLSREESLSYVVRDVKSASSGWIHENIKGEKMFAWQAGYAAFSVSQSSLEAVKNYIASQEEHHRTQTYRDELKVFLTKHGIEFKEEYLVE